MKKKSIIIASCTLAATLALTPALVACSGDHYTGVEFAAQDTSYTVTSQGGSVVSYGNYVYFINGTRGYDDADGTANVWNEVVKGGLYRAEYNGEKYTANDGTTRFKIAADNKGIEFRYTDGKDYFDEPIEIVNVDAIAPKTVGTSGYGKGGLFIYDNYAYFATPNNSKNSVGTVQTTRTDFFMMPLSGGKPVKLYTTGEGTDTSSSAYAFYKYGGSVYLVVNEGTKIISVRVDTGKAKADDPVSYDVGATSVCFPVRDVYYNGIDTNTPDDFIYYVRAVKDGEQKAGTVIEAMRPDGSEQFVVSMNGKTETIEGVRDGVLFYRTTDSTNKSVLAYDNLHDALMEKSPSYKAHQDSLDEKDKTAQISGRFTENMSNITSAYPFRVENSNVCYFIGSTSSAVSLYSSDGTSRTLASASGTLQFMNNGYIYYAGSSNDYHRVAVWENMEKYGEIQDLATAATAATFGCDYADGYFVYYGKVDEWADGYAQFYKVDGAEGYEPQFVGRRASSDIPTNEQIKDAKGEVDET